MEKVIGCHTLYYTFNDTKSISGVQIQFFVLQNSADSTEKRYLWVPVLAQIVTTLLILRGNQIIIR